MSAVTIILPAYNEAGALPALLAAIAADLAAALSPRVIVVDDGSTDDTAAVARDVLSSLPPSLLTAHHSLLAQVISHPRNLGLGAALRTGLLAAASDAADDDVIVVMDADNTHPPALIVDLARAIARGADVAIASRYAPGGREVGLSWYRRIMSRGASALLWAAFHVRGARDYTCGYRAYRAGILRRAISVWGDRLIEERGFVCMAELLIKLSRLGARIVEVPLVLRYDLKAGPSKVKIIPTILRYFRLIARARRLAKPLQ
jgi:dolichol-phosphate mannosyltransferase